MWPAVCRTRCEAPSAKERHPAGCLSCFVNARAPAHRKERNVCKGNLCRVSGYGWPRQVARHKRFAAGKTLAQAEFISAEHVKYPWGGAARGRECRHSRIPQGKECVQGKPLPGFPCTFNQRPPQAALIFASQKSAVPSLAPNNKTTPKGWFWLSDSLDAGTPAHRKERNVCKGNLRRVSLARSITRPQATTFAQQKCRTNKKRHTNVCLFLLVRAMGLEPTRSYEHRHLKPACLPIPARSRAEYPSIIAKSAALSIVPGEFPRPCPAERDVL